jgi:tetratricopeptide (TPR) repeat protein
MARPSPASLRWTLLSAVALLALVVRLVYINQISHAPFSDLRLGDAEAYHHWALRIAAGQWLGDGVFYQAPLYPYFLAAVYNVLGDGPSMIRFVQAVVGTGSCVLLAAAGMALFGTWGATAGALLAIYPSAIFLDGLLEKSVLVSFFTTAVLYLLSDRQVKLRALLAGVALGLLSLARENALLLAIPILAWFLIERRLAAAAFLAGCAMVLVPVGARNYAVGGEFLLTTAQFGPNFYIGNHEGARGLYEPLVPGRGNAAAEREDATRLAEEASRRTLSPDEVSSYWTARALEFIRTQPGAWVRQLARKLALTYNAVEIADTESQDVYAEWSSLLRALRPLSFSVIFCLAAFGVVMTADAWRRLWFLYAIALTYTLSIVSFYVFARYRFPLVPVLILLAAGGGAVWRETSARPMRRWALGAAVLAGGLAYLPLENTRMDRASHYLNIANAFLLDPEKWDDAEAFYGKALSASPQSAEPHFGMGMLLARRNRMREAVVHYRAAIERWPDNADIRLNLGLALAALGEVEPALDELDIASRLRPGDPTGHLIAGKLLLTQSRTDEAIERYRQALAINPNDEDARQALERLSR